MAHEATLQHSRYSINSSCPSAWLAASSGQSTEAVHRGGAQRRCTVVVLLLTPQPTPTPPQCSPVQHDFDLPVSQTRRHQRSVGPPEGKALESTHKPTWRHSCCCPSAQATPPQHSPVQHHFQLPAFQARCPQWPVHQHWTS
ncbi:unnamed protein product [Closterium sp. NIES-54]